MAILYYQHLQNDRIITNFYTHIGRKCLTNDSLLELREVLDHILLKERNPSMKLYKERMKNFYYVFVQDVTMFALICDCQMNESNITNLILKISETPDRTESLSTNSTRTISLNSILN